MRNRYQDDWNRNQGSREGHRPSYDQDRESGDRDRDQNRWTHERGGQSSRSEDSPFDDRDRYSPNDRESGYRIGDDRRYEESRSWPGEDRSPGGHAFGGHRQDTGSQRYGNEGRGSGRDGFGGGGYQQSYRGQSYGNESRSQYGQQQERALGTRGFSGKGPKGYIRSDDRMREEISDALMADDAVDASEIEVKVEDGEVTLTGTVESRQDKRAAEDIAERCQGVTNVQNSLRVSSASSSRGAGTESSRDERQRRTGDIEGESPTGELGRGRSTTTSKNR